MRECFLELANLLLDWSEGKRHPPQFAIENLAVRKALTDDPLADQFGFQIGYKTVRLFGCFTSRCKSRFGSCKFCFRVSKRSRGLFGLRPTPEPCALRPLKLGTPSLEQFLSRPNCRRSLGLLLLPLLDLRARR